MENDRLTERYFGWLASQLEDGHGNPNKTHHGLFEAMLQKEFGWVLPMDENRMVDGMDLRVEFAREIRCRPSDMERVGPCSFLEVLIGLSRRLAFAAGGEAAGWAWQLLVNLELSKLSDPFTRYKHRKANEIMDGVIGRTYMPDGTGGFFPLTRPDDDQTTVELWYQMHSFVEEIHPEH